LKSVQQYLVFSHFLPRTPDGLSENSKTIEYPSITLSDNSHHYTFRPFHSTAGSVALASIRICLVPNSMPYNSVCYS